MPEVKVYKAQDELLKDLPTLAKLKDFAYRIGANHQVTGHLGQKVAWAEGILDWQRNWGATETREPKAGDWCIRWKAPYKCVQGVDNKLVLEDLLGRETKFDAAQNEVILLDKIQFLTEGEHYSVGEELWHKSYRRKRTVSCIIRLGEMEHYYIDAEGYRLGSPTLQCQLAEDIGTLWSSWVPYRGQDIYPIKKVDEVPLNGAVYKIRSYCDVEYRDIQVNLSDRYGHHCVLSQNLDLPTSKWGSPLLKFGTGIKIGKGNDIQGLIDVMSYLKELCDRGLDDHFQELINEQNDKGR